VILKWLRYRDSKVTPRRCNMQGVQSVTSTRREEAMGVVETGTLRSLVRQVRRVPDPAIARAIRKGAGVSQAAVAAEVGVTRQAIALWESGARRPSGAHIDAYAAALAVLQEEIDGRPAA
jgi:DNA-binding transcriptional regulator YiaG